MRKPFPFSWVAVAVSAAMLLVLAAACGETKTIEVPGETIVVEKEVIKTIEVPGQTVTTEVIKEVRVPGETVTVTKEVVKLVEVPGETVVVPGETVVVKVEVEKTVEVPVEVIKEIPVEVVLAAPERYARTVWGEVVEKPKHGGSLVIGIAADWADMDPWYGGWSLQPNRLLFDKLGVMNWALDPKEYDWSKAGGLTRGAVTGALAESWEYGSDINEIIYHIRPGVAWHDKAPMNGRELIASDVEFTWHRMLGLGEFTEAGPTPFSGGFAALPIESVTATDRYTVSVKSSKFSFDTLDWTYFYSYYGAYIQPPEVVKQYGDLKDWKTLVGTGPYELTDYQSGGAYTYTRNPNYWMTDPRFPDLKLQLPYTDEIKYIVMPDVATRIAALRTGKTAWMRQLTVNQVLSLERTNPELITASVIGTADQAPKMLLHGPDPDREATLFTDINIRIAMQKALNLNEIASAYYLGYADPTPWGVANSGLTGTFVPYVDWPEETKVKYEYDPAAAEKLLDDAGYPRDADGIRFKTQYVVAAFYEDVDLAQLMKSYWDKIGVDVTLKLVTDSAIASDLARNRTYEGLDRCECRHKMTDPVAAMNYRFHTKNAPYDLLGLNDPTFEAILDSAASATDYDEKLKLYREADMYFINEMWSLTLPVVDAFVTYQPWLKGYRGELGGGEDDWATTPMFMWLDQELQNK